MRISWKNKINLCVFLLTVDILKGLGPNLYDIGLTRERITLQATLKVILLSMTRKEEIYKSILKK